MSVPNCSLYSDALSATPSAITGIVTQKDPVTGAAEAPTNSLYGSNPKAAAQQSSETTPRTPGEVTGASLSSSTLSALLGLAG